MLVSETGLDPQNLAGPADNAPHLSNLHKSSSEVGPNRAEHTSQTAITVNPSTELPNDPDENLEPFSHFRTPECERLYYANAGIECGYLSEQRSSVFGIRHSGNHTVQMLSV